MRTTVFFQKRVKPQEYFYFLSSITISVALMILLSLSPTKIHHLESFHAGSKINITRSYLSEKGQRIGIGELETVKIRLSFGASGGCMNFGDEGPICQQTLHLKPFISYLNLPEGQNITEHLGNTYGLAFQHVTTSLISLGWISYLLAPFVPNCFTISGIFTTFSMLSGMINLFIVFVSYFQMETNFGDSNIYPEFTCEVGNGMGILIIALFFIIVSTFYVNDLVSGIKRKNPPAEIETV